MATRATKKFDKTQPVTIYVPGRQVANIEAVHTIVCNTLGQLGCPGCLSGYSLHFTDIPYLVANEKLEVRAQ